MPFDILSHILRLKDNIFSIWMRFIHKLSKTGSIYVKVCTCVIKGYLDTQVNQWLETDLNCKYFETYLQCYVYVFISLLRIVNFFRSYIVYIENSQIFPVPPSSAVSFSHFDQKSIAPFCFISSIWIFLFVSISLPFYFNSKSVVFISIVIFAYTI